jgi:hypothetical protein
VYRTQHDGSTSTVACEGTTVIRCCVRGNSNEFTERHCDIPGERSQERVIDLGYRLKPKLSIRNSKTMTQERERPYGSKATMSKREDTAPPENGRSSSKPTNEYVLNVAFTPLLALSVKLFLR